MEYLINNTFNLNCGFALVADDIFNASIQTNTILCDLPSTIYRSLDFKTISSIVGAVFCDTIANLLENAIVNPIEKGHPDIIPIAAENCTEEQLRNYPEGLEVKCTVGNIRAGAGLRAGQTRIDDLTGITWQAHHREVESLLGLIWDFIESGKSFKFPTITGAFFTDELSEQDWGEISGTTGRNTKVTGMRTSGKQKMGEGWIVLLDDEMYLDKYTKNLKFII